MAFGFPAKKTPDQPITLRLSRSSRKSSSLSCRPRSAHRRRRPRGARRTKLSLRQATSNATRTRRVEAMALGAANLVFLLCVWSLWQACPVFILVAQGKPKEKQQLTCRCIRILFHLGCSRETKEKKENTLCPFFGVRGSQRKINTTLLRPDFDTYFKLDMAHPKSVQTLCVCACVFVSVCLCLCFLRDNLFSSL